ncbi:GAP family protein [Mycolicibacterium sp. ND9-15]|uniref:GAP family protein n=1 Tax=Mycolicibacterium sp. ND9-15 TaxID=3042320 RepID=UPI002DDB3AAB|nr:GAP family protein [Mycolicibacterium sp. ND9-15]WSE54921.1 GAP family protein [Mycolicibacterium sp. ND9-15]
MWGSLLALALLAGLNPVRLGIALLVISRPRPMQNLLIYWIGCLTVGVLFLLVPLMVLHNTPALASFAKDLGTPATDVNSTVRLVQVWVGVLALIIAAVMAVRHMARQRAQASALSGNASESPQESSTPNAITRLFSPARDGSTQGRGVIRGLLARTYNAWENGSLWVAFVIGLLSGPGADGALYVLAIILPTGAATGTQVSAVIAFVLVMFAVEEIALASYLVTPARTQGVVQRLHDWALEHRRQLLVALFAVGGIALVANGTGLV